MPAKKTKTPAAPKAAAFPAELQAKVDAYAELHGTTADKVVHLAVDDFFHNVDQGRWPRSNSILEQSEIIKA